MLLSKPPSLLLFGSVNLNNSVQTVSDCDRDWNAGNKDKIFIQPATTVANGMQSQRDFGKVCEQCPRVTSQEAGLCV